MDKDVAFSRITERQHGLITYAQLRLIGVTRGELARGPWRRHLRRVQRGVYAVAGSPRTWHQTVLAAVLAGGAEAVASHLTAAALHGFPDAGPGQSCEILLPRPHQVRAKGVRVHRHGIVEPMDRIVIDGIPVSSFARTLVDCSGALSIRRLGRALDDGVVRRRVTLRDVAECVERLAPAPGRRPVLIRALLVRRGPELERAESSPEARICRVLTGAGLPQPTQQHWVRLGGDRFRLDLAYPRLRLVIEYDGWDAHRSRTAFDDDRRRDRLLSAAGWTTLRVTSATTDAELVRAVASLLARSA